MHEGRIRAKGPWRGSGNGARSTFRHPSRSRLKVHGLSRFLGPGEGLVTLSVAAPKLDLVVPFNVTTLLAFIIHDWPTQIRLGQGLLFGRLLFHPLAADGTIWCFNTLFSHLKLQG